MSDLFGSKSADFSPCRNYRYALWRWWDESIPYAMFVGLNPSTADEIDDDRTITRCINFAKSWGYGGLCMTNLFALRTKHPKVMKAHNSPVGIENNKWLISLSKDAGIIIAAWGVDGIHMRRDEEVKAMINNLHCLEKTKEGHPKHPLYIKADTQPFIL